MSENVFKMVIISENRKSNIAMIAAIIADGAFSFARVSVIY